MPLALGRGRLLSLIGAATLVAGCLRDVPLPNPGACADLPDGVYEYGQMRIGTCLAGPTDLAFLDGGRVLAVSNANPWKDFTGGSALFLDLSTVEWDNGRNVIGPDASRDPTASVPGADGVVARAVALPSFAGAMALADPHDLLLVTNRLSEDERTREDADTVWFIDVADPDAPALAEIGPDGASVEVGWDPSGIHYDAATDLAWVVNRTAHTVTMLDLATDPVELVPPGGRTRLDAGVYADTDGSGSKAGFVALEMEEDPDVGAYTWSLSWSVGTVRVWVPTVEGVYRVTGNGESLWTRSNLELDLDVADSEEEVLAVSDPSFLLEESSTGAAYGRMVFVDQGVIRGAVARGSMEEWAFEDDPILSAGGSWDTEIGGPSMLIAGGVWYLFYDGGSGAEGSIGLATSADGATFSRASGAAVLAADGVSLTDPYVFWDEQAAQWRMFLTVDGAEIGQAVSDDLSTWTLLDDRFVAIGGAWAPTVAYLNGAFHLIYTTAGAEGDVVGQATSLDGFTWVEGAAPFDVDAGSFPAGGGVALQWSPEEAFSLEDQGGTLLPTTLEPGATLTSATGGWSVRVAVGQVSDPDEVGMASLSLGSVLGDQAYLSFTDADGVNAIGTGTRLGDNLLLDEAPLLEAGAGGAHDIDGVYDPVVVELNGQWVMYYAAEADGVVTVGRATSADGEAWSADPAPVLTATADWDSVAVEPASVQVLDDGTVRLWFSAFDGERYRIGLAESADGEAFTRVPGTQDDWQLDAGAPGAWYDSGVRHASVLRDGAIDRMWFSGSSGESWALGYAERSADPDADEGDWVTAVDADGSERPILEPGFGGFGAAALVRPVVAPTENGWELWYTGLDGTPSQGRIGRAVTTDGTHLHRDLRMPSLADTWSFTSVPAREGESLSLDVVTDAGQVPGLGCGAIAEDPDRGFLFVGCKLSPYVYVIDIRDDSTESLADLNYLDVEAVYIVETSTGGGSGLRSLVMDRARGWLWGVSDEPESIVAIDVSALEDDGDTEIYRETVLTMLPLPRNDRDEGVETRSTVGPAQIVLHPDGHHLLVTNFNHNSVSAYDLALGATGTLVAQTEAIGENPYAIRISDDGTLAAVANYAGEVDGSVVSSTVALLDADPTSPTFLQVKTWLVNE